MATKCLKIEIFKKRLHPALDISVIFHWAKNARVGTNLRTSVIGSRVIFSDSVKSPPPYPLEMDKIAKKSKRIENPMTFPYIIGMKIFAHFENNFITQTRSRRKLNPNFLRFFHINCRNARSGPDLPSYPGNHCEL